VLLPQALLQRPEQILLPPSRGRRTLMLGFETILPFLRPLEPLILDDSVSEIMVNGAGHVFIERAGVLEEVPDIHLTEQSLMVAVKNIARRLGSDISEEKPILDSRLPDGSRVAVVIPPCSLCGAAYELRPRAKEHPHQRRYRNWKNDHREHSRKVHRG